AMFNKGIAHRKLGDNDKAIATYEQVVDIYQADTTLSIRELVVNAMFNKGIAHNQIGDNNKEIAAYGQIIDAYHADSAPAIRERVANAMNGRGFNSLLTAKQALANQKEPEANELLHKALADLLAAIERKPEWGMALGNLAYAQWLLKLPAEAEASFRSALSSKEDSGEFLYKATLDDIAQHPIPEDASFREMVERLWAEYQAQKTNGN
ncbi:MAG: tetratricopeptide repeat protein, partial [Rhodocyclales bacterium]|nr:tetratricopeptide repeat protein [Rhodocyclales bacterium]